ncbi:Uncharacterized protein conserved in bacteria [Cedecea neteri]|uniref:Uncharacterized protein conserved in bacteria n=1 Tax=Cedecea neteri TaxID=158822 RepID=A0A2X3IGN7_9ENTR|nr:Uncharacterized protein conserved in bacteria [Cedecea neteri]
MRLRLRTARALLAQGKEPALVASQTGFADQSHMGRWFQRAYRLSPVAYQRPLHKRSILTALPSSMMSSQKDETEKQDRCLIPKLPFIVRDDLPTWQRLNVVAFLGTGVAAASPEIMGAPYIDAKGREYGNLSGQPMLIFESDLAGLQTAHRKGLERDLTLIPYVHGMFSTGHDASQPGSISGGRCRQHEPGRPGNARPEEGGR